MKKILGITAALATVLGFSQVVRVHAEGTPVEPTTPTTEETTPESSTDNTQPVNPSTPDGNNDGVLTKEFKDIQAHAKINMTYDIELKKAETMLLKFGGELPKDLIDTVNKDYGIIVLDSTKDPNAQNISSLSYNQVIEYQKKHMTTSIDEKIDELAQNPDFKDKKSYEVNWVITNTLSLGYNRSFTAAFYEIHGETVTLSKECKYSTLDVVNAYIGMKEDSVVGPVIPVLENFRDNYEIQYKVTSGFLYENTPGYNGDSWFDLKVVDHKGNYLTTATASNNDTLFTFNLNHNVNNIRFQYWNKNSDNKARESMNFNIVDGKLVHDNVKVEVTWDDINANMKDMNYYENHRKIYLRCWNNAFPNDAKWYVLDEPLNRMVDVNSIYTHCMVVIKSLDNPGENFEGNPGKTLDFKIVDGKLVK